MKRYKSTASIEKQMENPAPLPPRGQRHKTDRNKWTKIFYRTLAVIFIVLTLSLLAWGFLFE